jgi:hypothetical protein
VSSRPGATCTGLFDVHMEYANEIDYDALKSKFMDASDELGVTLEPKVFALWKLRVVSLYRIDRARRKLRDESTGTGHLWSDLGTRYHWR